MISVSESGNNNNNSINNNNNAYYCLWEEEERAVQHGQPVTATPLIRRIWIICFLPFIIVLGCRSLETHPLRSPHGNSIDERVLREFENRVRDTEEDEAQIPLRQMDSVTLCLTLTRKLMKIFIILMIGFIIAVLITYFRNRA